jgi:hypothetical protein
VSTLRASHVQQRCLLHLPVVSLFHQIVFVQVTILSRIIAGDVLVLDDRDGDDLGSDAFTQGPSTPVDLELVLPAFERRMTLQPFLQDEVDVRLAEFPVTSQFAMQGWNDFDSLRLQAQISVNWPAPACLFQGMAIPRPVLPVREAKSQVGPQGSLSGYQGEELVSNLDDHSSW